MTDLSDIARQLLAEDYAETQQRLREHPEVVADAIEGLFRGAELRHLLQEARARQ